MIFFQSDSKGKDKMKKGTKLRLLSSFARSGPLMVGFFSPSCFLPNLSPYVHFKLVAQISKCGICQDTLVNPKSLHSFCLACLESQTKKGIGFLFPSFLCSACHLVDFNHSRLSSLSTAWCHPLPMGRLCLIQTMSSVSSARKKNLPPHTVQSVQAFCANSAQDFTEDCRPPSTTKRRLLMRPSLARIRQPKGFLGVPSIL